MIAYPLTVRTIAQWCSADVIGSSDLLINDIVIDSRKAQSRMLFVALRGSKTDGHLFVNELLQLQYIAIIISIAYYKQNDAQLRAQLTDSTNAALVVKNSLRAVQMVAQRYLQKFDGLKRIAITGSTGKTTCKEILGNILKRYRKSFYSVGNYNSDIGVPLSVFTLQKQTVFALFEVGTNRRGEIAEIAKVVQPHIVIITNIGHAHIAYFGSLQEIASEKISLATNSAHLETVFLNAHDTYPQIHLNKIAKKIIYYDRDTHTASLTLQPHPQHSLLTYNNHTVQTKLRGEFQLQNVRAVIACARSVGCAPAHILQGIKEYQPLFGRLEVIEGNIFILQDCYNASPESMESALRYCAQLPWAGRKIAILGAMKELGAQSDYFHRRVIDLALSMQFHHIYCIGEEFATVVAAHAASAISYYGHIDTLEQALRSALKQGDFVLLKGSREMQLERLTPLIQSIGARA